MYSEDFILRQISMAVAILAQVLRLKRSGQTQEALQAIDQAVEALLGLRLGLAKQLDDQALVALCVTQNHVDAGRAAVLSDLFKEEAEILAQQNLPAESAHAYTQALRLALEAALSEMDYLTPAQITNIEALARLAPPDHLTVEGRLAFLDYSEALLRKDPQLLAAANLPPEILQTRIARLHTDLRPFLEP
jgi:hypothetical protein